MTQGPKGIARAALLSCVVLAFSLLLSDCQSLTNFAENAYLDLTTGTPDQASQVATANAAFTVLAKTATVWAQSGHETPDQARIVEGFRVAAWNALQAANVAVTGCVSDAPPGSTCDSATAAAGISLFNSALATLNDFMTKNGAVPAGVPVSELTPQSLRGSILSAARANALLARLAPNPLGERA